YRAVWRPLRVAAHLPHSSWLSPPLAGARRPPVALRDAVISGDDNFRRPRRAGNPDLDLVGARNASHTRGRRSVAVAADHPLLRMGTAARKSGRLALHPDRQRA